MCDRYENSRTEKSLPPYLPLLKGEGGETKKSRFYSPLRVGEGLGERSKRLSLVAW
ncbi:hypothetical protein NIES4103_29870 [Nostoc sp. NIES-4103]|nr:hypothetical protein NIES4103_29870 [Nostoc sp. NIES-4103]